MIGWHQLLKRVVILALAVWMGSPGHAQSVLNDPSAWGGDEVIEPINAPFPMEELTRPEFPDRVISIVDHGAVEGGEVKNTNAFATAIEICSASGGGRVHVPAGKWLTGPIHLKSNVNLFLDRDAEVIFSDDINDYLPVVFLRVGGIEVFNYSTLIYARDCENIAITGPGKLNGNSEKWWPWSRRETKEFFDMGQAGVPLEKRVFGTEEAAIRPCFISFVDCRNILMEGFTIGGGPNWTINPIYCDKTIIRRVNVITEGPNNDGVDPDSCTNMLIEHCVFDTGDDCVVLKSGYNEDGWRVGRPTENIVMRHCFSKRGHGGLVIGSEMSGDVRNVYMHDCEFEGTDRAVRIKSKRGRGGVVENVWAHDLKVKDMQREVVILNMVYGSDRKVPGNTRPPTFRNIHISNVVGDGAPTGILIRGLEDSPIYNVTFDNIRINSTLGVVASNVHDIKFNDIVVDPSEGPVFDLRNAKDVTITQAKSPDGDEVFLKLEGEISGGVKIAESDLSAAAKPTELGEGVSADAVVIE